jgi:hypothetical protein
MKKPWILLLLSILTFAFYPLDEESVLQSEVSQSDPAKRKPVIQNHPRSKLHRNPNRPQVIYRDDQNPSQIEADAEDREESGQEESSQKTAAAQENREQSPD